MHWLHADVYELGKRLGDGHLAHGKVGWQSGEDGLSVLPSTYCQQGFQQAELLIFAVLEIRCVSKRLN